jgi:hypothetical protein
MDAMQRNRLPTLKGLLISPAFFRGDVQQAAISADGKW